MTRSVRRALLLSAAFFGTGSGVAHAGTIAGAGQDQQSEVASTDAPQADDALGLNDIIVTGTRTGTRKFETSYAITTIDDAQIAEKAPLSVADLISSTPGIYVESSGGVVGNKRIPRHPKAKKALEDTSNRSPASRCEGSRLPGLV